MLDSTVLIYEQDKKVAQYITSLVKELGFSSLTIPNIKEVIDKTLDLQPDLILVNVNEKNIEEIIKLAGQIYSNIDSCFLFISNKLTTTILEKEDFSFAYTVVVEPFNKKELKTAINNLIEKHKLELRFKSLEAFYESTVQNLSDCVILTDANTKIIKINKSASQLIDVEAENALGREISQFIKLYSNEDEPKETDLKDSFSIQNLLKADLDQFCIKDKNGSKLKIKLKIVPFSSSTGANGSEGLSFIFNEVNEVKESEQTKPQAAEIQDSQSIDYFSAPVSKPDSDLVNDDSKTVENSISNESNTASHENILNSILQATYGLDSIDEILNETVDVLKNGLENADFVALYLVRNQSVGLKYHKGLKDELLKDITKLFYSKGLPWASIISESSANIEKVNENRYITEAEKKVGFKSFLSVPVRQNGVTIGSLNLYSVQREGAFSDSEINLLDTICKQLEITFGYLGKFEELRQSEQKFQSLFDKAPVGVLLLDSGSKIYQCNRRVAEILQSTFDKITELDITEFGNEKFTASVRKMLKGSFSKGEFCLTIPGKNREVWLLASLSPVKGKDDGIEGGMVVLEDITERKKMENAIVEEKELLSITLKSIGDGVIATDSDGKIVLMNRVAESITEWTNEEVCGKKLQDILIVDPRTKQSIKDKIYGTANQKNKNLSIKDDIRIKSKNNKEKVINASSSPIKDKENNFIGDVIVFHDVTEDQNLKSELVKVQKLESLETLAGGIAHDFNNMLTGIIGNLSLSKMYVDSQDKIYKRLSEAENECFRAADLTKQLINFAEGIAPNKKVSSISDLVEESVKFVLTGSKVKSSFSSSEDIWFVEIDQRQIIQAIYDITLNSLQAMPNGGNINTSIQNVQIKQNVNNVVENGEYVKIVIEDTGTGISDETVSKIYDPYFSTKDKHAGLGLSNTYTTIKSHKGFIKVDSKEGEGTKVSIYLPASKDVIPLLDEEIANQAAGKAEEGQKGRILIMDDDEVIREIAGSILGYFGYEVYFASDGKQAIDLYMNAKENGQKYDVVIMDLTIPGGMGAEDTIKKLIDLDPEIKAIVSSGYSNAPIISDFYKYGFKGAVSKPFRIEELTKTVRDVLVDKNINTLPI